jgi:hypothetical protein
MQHHTVISWNYPYLVLSIIVIAAVKLNSEIRHGGDLIKITYHVVWWLVVKVIMARQKVFLNLKRFNRCFFSISNKENQSSITSITIVQFFCYILCATIHKDVKLSQFLKRIVQSGWSQIRAVTLSYRYYHRTVKRTGWKLKLKLNW